MQKAAPHWNLLGCAVSVIEEKGLSGKTQKSPVLMVNFGGDVWVRIVGLKFVNFSFLRRFADFTATLDSQKGKFVIWAQIVVGLGGLVGFRCFCRLGWLV